MLPSCFDLCVLGAGPAGYAAAVRAHDLGKKVLLVERERIGGAGIHAGALSSKTMWHLSNDYANACRTGRGYLAGDVQVSYAAVMESLRQAVSERRGLFEQQLEALAQPADTGGQVWLLKGTGRFLTPHAIEVAQIDGSLLRYEADHFLIATGSKPKVPDGIEVDGVHIVTSDQIEDLEVFPRSLVILGAGVVGCEYATIFANFRRTRIHLLDRQPRVLPFEDEDISEEVSRSFERMGIIVHREPQLASMRVVDGQVEFVLQHPAGTSEPHRVERALISTGRAANTASLDLAAAGVKVDARGGVITKQTRTSAPHIYAAGDVSMDVALANVAELEGRVAVERMFGQEPRPICYEALSTIMFLAPEVAAVGLNEQQARQRQVPYRFAVVQNRLVSRNIAMGATEGFLKLLATPEGRILGLRVVGRQASSAVQGTAFLIETQGTLEQIDGCLHPHPAIAEGVQECARLLLGKSLHKASIFGPELLRCGSG